MKIQIICLVLGIVAFAGCSNTQDVEVKSSKKEAKYVPVKIEEAPPAVKRDENVVHIGNTPLEFKKTNQEDIEKYQRDQEQMSDFQKHMLYRDYKIVK